MTFVKVIAGLLVALIAVPAMAGTVIYTFTGTVLGGSGYPFGPVVAGTPFSAVFTWTPEVRPYQINNAGTSRYVEGGPYYGQPQNIAAVLTINNISYAFGSDRASIQRKNDYDFGHPNGTLDGAAGYASNFNARLDSLGVSLESFSEFVDDADLIAPGSYTLSGANEFNSYYQIGYDYLYNQPSYGVGTLQATRVDIAVNGPITVNTSVPEPAAWSLMILGFGLIGAAARSRYPRAATI